MCIKSSNLKDDYLLVSCGNEDDPTIKFWNFKDQTSLDKFAREDQERIPYYYLNMILLKNGEVFEKDPFSMENNEEDKLKMGFVVFVATIRGIDVYMKNPNSQVCRWNGESTQEDVGSYLSPMTMIMHEDNTFTLLVCTISGLLEQFNFQFDGQDDAEKSSQGLSSRTFESNSNKTTPLDEKKYDENRIKITAGVDIRSLIEKHRKQGKFTEESMIETEENQESISQVPEHQALNREKPSLDFKQSSKEIGKEETGSRGGAKENENLDFKESIGRDPMDEHEISGINMQVDLQKAESLDEKI